MSQKKSRKPTWGSYGTEKYRRYHEAKAKIPMGLSAQEYEERVRELARKYKI